VFVEVTSGRLYEPVARRDLLDERPSLRQAGIENAHAPLIAFAKRIGLTPAFLGHEWVLMAIKSGGLDLHSDALALHMDPNGSDTSPGVLQRSFYFTAVFILAHYFYPGRDPMAVANVAKEHLGHRTVKSKAAWSNPIEDGAFRRRFLDACRALEASSNFVSEFGAENNASFRYGPLAARALEERLLGYAEYDALEDPPSEDDQISRGWSPTYPSPTPG
jgi:hypothetical protein